MTFAVYSSPSSIRTPSRSIASSHNWETNRCFYNEINVILCTNISFCSFVKIPWKCKIVNKTKKEFTIVFFDLTNTRASGSSTNFNIPTQILSELSPKVQVTASVLKTVTSLTKLATWSYWIEENTSSTQIGSWSGDPVLVIGRNLDPGREDRAPPPSESGRNLEQSIHLSRWEGWA